MSEEKFQPSSEEIKMAEDSMTPEQAEASLERLRKFRDTLEMMKSHLTTLERNVNEMEELVAAGRNTPGKGLGNLLLELDKMIADLDLMRLEKLDEEAEKLKNFIKSDQNQVSQLGEFNKE